MYSLDTRRLQRLPAGRWSGVGPNVVYLGLTSMLTDISSEMVASILPIYLVFALRLTPLQFGFIDGLSQGLTAVARLASGLLADRWQRNREIAGAGYTLSAICKIGLVAAGNAWGLLSGVIILDRIGKGIRTSPRDALISMSSPSHHLGLAFGVHRAFDTFGALLGPLVAFALLFMLPGAYDFVFVSSFFIAIVGVAVLLCFVRNVGHEGPRATSERVPRAKAVDLLRDRPFRALVLAGSVLGLVTVADSFFYLLLQRKTSMQPGTIPLLFVVTALSYLVFAIPAGRLGDRIGRGQMFLLGHGLLVLACVNLLFAGSGWFSGLLSLTLLGAYYACTDGVLMAAASAVLPMHLRATGLAILATSTGVSRFLASLIFGALWNWRGIEFALGVFAAGLIAAMLAAAKTCVRLEAVH